MKIINRALMGGGARLPVSFFDARRGLVFEPANEGGGAEGKTAQELALEVKSAFQKSFDQVKEIAEKALAEANKAGGLTVSLKEKADEELLKMNGLSEKLAALEQKAVEGFGRGGGADQNKSIGEDFTESKAFKDFIATPDRKGRVTFETKATLTSLTTDAAGSVGDAIRPTRLAGIDPLPRRRMTIRNLVSPGRMDGSSIEYVQQTGYSRNAGMVAEGARKPQSDIKMDLKTAPARVIAHHTKASRQVLDDIPALRSTIDDELLYGLELKEEGQLLAGDGTGQNLLGIIPQATAYVAPITLSSPTSIDMIRLMMLQAALAEYPASGIVMHPADWAWCETLKDSEGRYIIGNPQGAITPTLWRLPVVETQAISIDKVLVGAFRGGAQIFDRWTARVELATQNEDDFLNNLIALLCEERLAFAVKRPEAFIYGDFGRVS